MVKKLVSSLLVVVSIMLLNQSPSYAYNAEKRVTLSQQNVGDFLIVPSFMTYYEIETKLNVINTSNDYYIVANVVFRSALYAINIMSFLVYLTPNDIWEGQITLNTTGMPVMYSTDASSYSDKNNEVITSVTNPFLRAFDFKQLKEGDTNLFGYIEIQGIKAYQPISETDVILPKDIYEAYHSSKTTLIKEVKDFPNILSAIYKLASDYDEQQAHIEAEALKNWNFFTSETDQQIIIQNDSTDADALELKKTLVNTIPEIEAAIAKTQVSFPFDFSSEGFSDMAIMMTFPGRFINESVYQGFQDTGINMEYEVYDTNGSLIATTKALIAIQPVVRMRALLPMIEDIVNKGYDKGTITIKFPEGSTIGANSKDGGQIAYKGAPVIFSYMSVKQNGEISFNINKGSAVSYDPIYLHSCTVNRSKGNAPLKVDFNLKVNDDFNSYEYLWDFGDGNTSTERNPSHTYKKEGTFTPTVIVKALGDLSITASTHPIIVEPDFGPPKAIVVAGGGPFSGNDLWKTTQELADYAYIVLRNQGYTEENIMYLSSDTEHQVAVNDTVKGRVNQSATNANLKQAITEWSKGARELLVYITDHGGTEHFIMGENEYLQAAELDKWLDKIQLSIPQKVIFIYDACHSGSFLPLVTPDETKKRISITSTDAVEYAFFSPDGGRMSFSRYFWQEIYKGRNLFDAFDLTKKIVQDTFQERQSPLLDADGNGNGKEYTIDGSLIKDVIIGDGTLKGADSEMVGSISPAQTLNGETSADIYAENVMEGVERVWAVILPPVIKNDDTEQPVIDMPVVELTYADNNRYEGKYDGFNEAGAYSIAIFAQDKTGILSMPKRTSVTQTHGMTAPPKPPIITIINNGTHVDFSWTRVQEATGYYLYFAPFDLSYVASFDMGTSLSLSADFANYAENGFYAAVRAYNAAGESDYSNIEFINFK